MSGERREDGGEDGGGGVVVAEPLRDDLLLLTKRHERYCRRLLAALPSALESMESARMTLVFFAVSTLDVIGSLDAALTPEEKNRAADWIYTLQEEEPASDSATFRHGFRGSNSVRVAGRDLPAVDGGHLAMTYTALATLVVLGDDLSRVNRASISAGLRRLQQPDGGFAASAEAAEKDMRFLYCAAAICRLLDDWSGLDAEAAIGYVRRSLSYDGAFGQGPGLESHGGSTYCALAALSLMGRLEEALGERERQRLLRWCLFRLRRGFQGRPNKPDDTCYTFWVGASVRILCRDGREAEAMGAVVKRSHRFALNAQDPVVGGFAKWAASSDRTTSDPMHTYMGVSGMSLFDRDDLRTVHPGLNITHRAVDHLKKVQEAW